MKAWIASSIVGFVVGAFGAVLGYEIFGRTFAEDFPRLMPSMVVDTVLDGDTVVKDGRSIHIRGLDAPELGPWAKCWAEAALAGVAKERLEAALFDANRKWRMQDLRADGPDRYSARIVDKDGFEITDEMRVYGGSAITDKRWDWCSGLVPLRVVNEEDRPPIGPQLWWPSGNVFDSRAAD